ncbi:hypothetical protein [Deinococcus sonorensis]|uniref:Uncharacterized protein n=2 Tax=Deinococcus sonorensis TaxID=309891 RepID=A0AAU7U7I0_9DEIO
MLTCCIEYVSPDGCWHTLVPLEGDRVYQPEELPVTAGPWSGTVTHRLSLRGERPLSEAAFRAVAARAATRSAAVSCSRSQQLLNLLIPF